MSKRLRFSRELSYILGIIIMPFAVTLCTKANLGLSMIAAPAYIVSEGTPLTYGQTEYILQALVLVLMCLIVKKFKLIYLTSFITAIIYGTVLDFFIWTMSGFELTALWSRILFFACGTVLTSLGVALFLNTYLAPCAYDYLVRQVVEEKKVDLKKFKTGNDITYLAVSIALTLALHHKFIGITWCTLIIVVVNGQLISMFSKFIQNHFELFNRFPKLAKIF